MVALVKLDLRGCISLVTLPRETGGLSYLT